MASLPWIGDPRPEHLLSMTPAERKLAGYFIEDINYDLFKVGTTYASVFCDGNRGASVGSDPSVLRSG